MVTKPSVGLTVSAPPIGTTDISIVDPVVVGRDAFSATNHFVDGLVGYMQDILCAVLDTVLDTAKGIYSLGLTSPLILSICMHVLLSHGYGLNSNMLRIKGITNGVSVFNVKEMG